MEHREDFVFGQRGSTLKALAGASVTVYYAGTTTLATIYSDKTGTPKANPITCDSSGKYDYWGAGYYKEVASISGYSPTTKDDINLGLKSRTITSGGVFDPLTDGVIFINTTNSYFGLDLCAIADLRSSEPIWIQLIGTGANQTIIVPVVGETINGESSISLTIPNERIGLIKQSSTNWQTI